MRESGFDAVSSIGLTEHIGVRQLSGVLPLPASRRCAPAGCCSTTASPGPTTAPAPSAGGFIDRYVFPDGELTGSGRIITEAQNVGLEVVHEENLRHHYALTLRDWCRNLVDHWDEAVAEVGLPTAKVWGLYMAGSRLGFETQRRSAAPGSGRQARTEGRRRRTAAAAVVDALATNSVDSTGAEFVLQ